MKKKLLSVLLAGMMVFGLPAGVMAEELSAEPVQSAEIPSEDVFSDEEAELPAFPVEENVDMAEELPSEEAGITEDIAVFEEDMISPEITAEEDLLLDDNGSAEEDLLTEEEGGLLEEDLLQDELGDDALPGEDMTAIGGEAPASGEDSGEELTLEETAAEDAEPERVGGSSFSSATNVTFGSTYSGNISNSVTAGFYKIVLPSSGRIVIHARAYMKYIYFTLYNGSQEQLYRHNSYWDSTIGQSNTKFTFDLKKGTYYFVPSKDYTYNGSYSFSVSFTSAGESFTESGKGDTLENAQPISLGQLYKGQIARNDDRDFYKFVLSTSGRVMIYGSAYIDNCYFYLYDQNHTQIQEMYVRRDSSTGKGSLNSWFELTAGTYYFAVVKSSGNTGNYSFKINYSNANESFKETSGGSNEDKDHAQTITLGTSYKGQLACNETCDYYRFTLTDPKVVTVALSSRIDDNVYFRLLDSDENVIWEKYIKYEEGGSASSHSEDIALSAGTYYFHLKKYNSKFDMGTYTFRIGQKSFPSTYLYRVTDVGSGGIRMLWKAQTGKVDGYQLRWSQVSSFKKGTKSASYKGTNSCVREGLQVGKTYYVQIRTFILFNGTKMFSNWSGTKSVTLTRTLTGTKITSAARTSYSNIRVRWNRISGVEGYQIRYADNSGFTNAGTVTIPGASKYYYTKSVGGGKWFFRIRTYKTASDGTRYYSRWSDTVQVN